MSDLPPDYSDAQKYTGANADNTDTPAYPPPPPMNNANEQAPAYNDDHDKKPSMYLCMFASSLYAC